MRRDIAIKWWLTVAEVAMRGGYYADLLSDYALRQALAYEEPDSDAQLLRRDSEVWN
jgi:hypothetical protein